MTRQKILAESVRDSAILLKRYLIDFNDTNHTAQAPGLPNHVAWTLGHLALTLNRTAEKLDRQALPESDFRKGDGGSGFFDTESVGFGSRPVNDPSRYPSFARSVAIFDAAIDRCARACDGATDDQLDAMTKWGPMEIPVWKLLPRMVFHNGTHNGQIADLRRALGMGSIFR